MCPDVRPADATTCTVGSPSCNYGEVVCQCNGTPNCAPGDCSQGNWSCRLDGAALAGRARVDSAELTLRCDAGPTATGQVVITYDNSGRTEPLEVSISDAIFHLVSRAPEQRVDWIHPLEPRITGPLAPGASQQVTHTLLRAAGHSNQQILTCMSFCGGSFTLELGVGLESNGLSRSGSVSLLSGSIGCVR